jgi:hypothetical protein
MTFEEASKSLKSLSSKIKTESVDLANLGEKKLEEELLKYQIEVARRDRLGPFLGQVLMNTSCLFEDATTLSSHGTIPDMQSVATYGGLN